MPIEAPTIASGSVTAATTGIKAFALAHPVGLTIVGGALLGIGGYYAVAKLLRKKDDAPAEAASAPA